MDRLAQRWGVTPSRVLVILLVFACTGFTVLFLKRPVVAYFAGEGEQPLLFSILYYVLILPVYNVILLVYGALFGQFRFFWEFEKRFFRRITGKKS
ncbi:MAG: diacylglyceryl transferase [Flavobacteriales bacterium]|nr:diacylglyceryl transferase [Flavobacteriales bacterium]